MSILTGDRLLFHRGAYAGRKAVVVSPLITTEDWQGFGIRFEDGAEPFVAAVKFERDWSADLSFYDGVELTCECVGVWRAVYHGDDEYPNRHGWGATREEALAELGLNLVERVDDRLYDMREAGEWDPVTMEECFTAIDGLSYCPW